MMTEFKDNNDNINKYNNKNTPLITMILILSPQVVVADVTQVSFWDRVLEPREVRDAASCRTLARGNVFSSDTSTVEEFGVSSEWVNLDQICK